MALSIDKLSDHTGAEVTGIDLTQPNDAATRARLNQAFTDNSVLVVRGQTLSPLQVLTAVQLFGEVFPQHNTRFALAECPLHRRHAIPVRAPAVDQPGHVGRQQDEALGSGHETERLAQRLRQARRQVGDGHQHKHQPAQRIDFPLALHRERSRI